MDISPSYKNGLRMSAPILALMTLGVLGLSTASASEYANPNDYEGMALLTFFLFFVVHFDGSGVHLLRHGAKQRC